MRNDTRRAGLLRLSRVFFTCAILSCFALASRSAAQSSEKRHGIDIKGSAAFIQQVAKALDSLEEKAPQAYKIVREYIGRIEQGPRSGMWAAKTPPTYEMADPTAFYSVTWCAGSIAHDAFHSKLYHDHVKKNGGPVPDEVWIGIDAEKRCLSHQLAVLKKIGAPKREVDHCAKQKGTHHDVNKDGKYDWEDYKKRDWQPRP